MSHNFPPYEALTPGLYLIPTPIGNLEDITLRALRTLQSVDLIAAEDTRSARRLISHFAIQKPLRSLHKDNEAQRSPALVEACQQGQRIAYISEAGMPAISDPGTLLTQAMIRAQQPVIALPGPAAALTALIASGLSTDAFLFLGFPPHKQSRQRTWIAPFVHLPLSLIFYLSPHRVLDDLQHLQTLLGDRQACLAREITKIHEEYLRGPLSSLHEEISQRQHRLGELVLIVDGAPTEQAEQAQAWLLAQQDAARLGNQPQTLDSPEAALQADAHATLQQDIPLSKMAKQLAARWPQLSRKQAYEMLQELREQAQNLSS